MLVFRVPATALLPQQLCRLQLGLGVTRRLPLGLRVSQAVRRLLEFPSPDSLGLRMFGEVSPVLVLLCVLSQAMNKRRKGTTFIPQLET